MDRLSSLRNLSIRFPSHESAGDDGWHVDVSFGTENPDLMEWRVNVTSSRRALLMLFLFSDVGPDDAPTRLLKGSHATIARELLPHGKAGATLRQLSAEGYASTKSVRSHSQPAQPGPYTSAIPFWLMQHSRITGTSPAL